jgi:hypothetical protein
VVVLYYLSESNVLLRFLNPNRDPVADLSIWHDEDVSAVNPSNAVDLVTEILDLYLWDVTDIDGWFWPLTASRGLICSISGGCLFRLVAVPLDRSHQDLCHRVQPPTLEPRTEMNHSLLALWR